MFANIFGSLNHQHGHELGRIVLAAKTSRSPAKLPALAAFYFLLGFIFFNAPIIAQAETIAVRGGMHADFERLVFDWPRAVEYSLSQQNNTLKLSFKTSAQLNLAKVQRMGLKRIQSMQLESNPQETILRFILAPGMLGKASKAGTRIVLDIREGRVPETEVPKTEAPAAPKTEAPAAPKAEAAKSTEAAQPAAPPAPPAAAAPAPAAATQKTATELPAAVEPLSENSTAEMPTQSEAEKPEAALPSLDNLSFSNALAAKESSLNPNPPRQGLTSNTMPAPQAAPQTVPLAAPRLDVEQERLPGSTERAAAPYESATHSKLKRWKDMPEGPPLPAAPEVFLELDPGLDTALALYRRAGFVYVFFDRKLSRSPELLLAGGPVPSVPLNWLRDLPVTGFSFPEPTGGDVRVAQTGRRWQIILAPQPRSIPVNLGLSAQPDFALGARLLLPIQDAGEVISFTDPVLGDALRILPLAKAGEAIGSSWSYFDFQFVPAAQGVVLRLNNEALRVRKVSDGFEITAAGGLRLSPTRDTGEAGSDEQTLSGARAVLFRLNEWGRLPGETHADARRRLMQNIVDVPEAERDRARYALARFYFASGYGQEALSTLNELLRRQPDLRNRAEFRALRGAARALVNQPVGALRDLAIPELEESVEVTLWRAVAYAEQRNWSAAARDFMLADAYLSSYAEPFFTRFHLLAIEALLAEDNLTEAADLIVRFEKGKANSGTREQAAIAYLRGVLQAKNGYPARAERLWRQAARLPDQLYRTRATMELVDLEVAQKRLNPKAAAERLEGLRFAWRGDDLELDLLRRLGAFYLEADMVKEALQTFGDAVRLKPDSPFTAKLREDMATTFVDSFLGARANVLSPLDALAIYQQFSDLAPKGAEGEKLISNLVDRLVAVDLLERAGTLLQAQIERFSQPAKAATGARLAAIKLIDGKPDRALATLRETEEATLPPALISERLLLQARALSDLGQYESALNLLVNETTRDAVRLKADIAWRGEKWGLASAMFRQLLPAPTVKRKASAEEGQILVNLAITLAFQDDIVGLAALRLNYAPLLQDHPQRDSFLVLTRPENEETPLDAQSVQARVAEVDLFGSFLRSYRGKAVP